MSHKIPPSNMKTYFIFILVLMPQFIFCQYKITGKITNEKNEPLAFADVALFRANDSSKIAYGGISDFNGKYEVIHVKGNNYILKASMIGYHTFTEKIEVTNTDVIKNIVLKPVVTNLNEVTIEGGSINNEINKTDYFITDLDRKKASSSFDLISKIPQLRTDNMNYSISTMDGKPVKILINGLTATVQDLIGIRPDKVIKVEYYTIPPARYAGSGFASVINVITKKSQKGGNVVADLQNAITTGYSNDMINFKYNEKNSQFGFYYYLGHRSYSKRVMNERLNYLFHGNEFIKTITGTKSPFGYDQNFLSFNFIHVKDSNYTFRFNLSPHFTTSRNTSNYYFNNDKNGTSVSGIGSWHDSYKEFTPNADIYFLKNLPQKQALIFDVVINYFNTDDNYNRREISSLKDTVLNDAMMNNDIKRSIIAEALYTKKYKNVNVTYGARYNRGALSQKLKNHFDNSDYEMKTSEKYIYGEVIGHFKKLSYQANIGLSQNRFTDNNTPIHYSFFALRPLIRLSYQLSKKSTFTSYYRGSPHIPSLSELSLNQYFIDNNIVYKGNPLLVPYNTHNYSVKYILNVRRLFFSTQFQYYYAKNPILSEYSYSNNYILLYNNNQGWKREFLLSSSLNYNPFKSNWLQLKFYGAVYKFKNKFSSGIVNSLNGYLVYTSINLTYKNLTLNFKFQSSYRELESQTITTNPVDSHATLQYKHKNLTLMAGVWNPLSRALHNESRNVDSSIVDDNWTLDNFDNGRMIYFKINYDLNFGKHFRRATKKINNKDTDTGLFRIH